jgi:predicted amidohydrolase
MANPVERRAMRANTDRMIAMIDSAIQGSAPFLPVRLVVFPEFAHAAPVFATARELIDKLAIPIPNEHTERIGQKAREYDIYIQSGSMLEVDRRWPEVVFNTTCLVGPEGILPMKSMPARTTSRATTSRCFPSPTRPSGR